ncbi:hypothetical protein PMAYCL1PPCAC_01363, partial [Pristionchus mayeri]
FRSMLARLSTQSCRGLSHSSKLVSRKVLKKNVNPRARGNRDSLVDDLLDCIKTGFKDGSTLKDRLFGFTNSKMMVGASALGIGALALNGLRVGKKND